MRLSVTLIGLLVLGAISPTGSAAQQATRAQIIEQARDEFAAEDRIRQFGSAVNLDVGPPDSLWAVAVHELAQTYYEEGDSVSGEAWLRWAAWIDGSWEADNDRLLPSVVEGYAAARRDVADRARPVGVTSATSWRWSDALTMDAPAMIEIRGPEGASLTVTSDGEAMPMNFETSYDAGTHEFVVGGAGFEEVRVTRELLPGVTTVVDVRPYRSLSTEGSAIAQASLVEVSTVQAGATVCSTGFFVTDDGWVVTSGSAFQGDGPVQVRRLDGQGEYSDVRVGLRDPASGLVLLEVGASATSLGDARQMVSQEDVWSLSLRACGAAIAMSPGRILSPSPDNLSRWTLTTALSASGIGGPLVDPNGSLQGVLIDENTVLAGNVVADFIVQARRNLIAAILPENQEPSEQVIGASSGGGNTKWFLMAGAAVAGGAIALLRTDPPEPPPPGPGTITIKWGN